MIYKWERDNYSDGVASVLYIFFAVITLCVVMCILIFCYPYKVNEKLSMYEEENYKIETKVKETVQAYMNYEQETYKSLVENANLETLLIKYPELNSNELVKSEIEIYKENNTKIKELKEKAIMKRTYDFWWKFNIGD